MNASTLLRSLMSGASRLSRAAKLPEARIAIQSTWRRAFGSPAGPHTAPMPSAAPVPPPVHKEWAGEPDIDAVVVTQAPVLRLAARLPEPSVDTAVLPPPLPPLPPLPPPPPLPPLPLPPLPPLLPLLPLPPPLAPGQFISGCYADLAGQRDYKLFIPPQAAGQALPLVVMLHGCRQTPDDFALGTGMNHVAQAQGFFVLYPAQSTQASGQGCWNWFKYHHQHRDRGEPGLLAGMVREVMRSHAIDPQRVFVAGLSAGGSMAAILGDTYPDLFAAVGVHSGLPRGAAKTITAAFAAMSGTSPLLMGSVLQRSLLNAAPAASLGRALPTIVFHGDEDRTVHPVNGERVVAACLGAGLSGPVPALSEPGCSDNGRTYTRHCHHDGQGHVVSEHWVVHGSGHAWSGGHPGGSFTDPQGPDASREMIRFFLAHPAPQPGGIGAS